MITSYAFGKIEVDGREFTKDLMILPDGSVHDSWWRDEGHRLKLKDIEPVLEAKPKILVVGMGSPGEMTPDAALLSQLEIRGIELRSMPTEQAVREYNALLAKGEKVAACFHLTC